MGTNRPYLFPAVLLLLLDRILLSCQNAAPSSMTSNYTELETHSCLITASSSEGKMDFCEEKALSNGRRHSNVDENQLRGERRTNERVSAPLPLLRRVASGGSRPPGGPEKKGGEPATAVICCSRTRAGCD